MCSNTIDKTIVGLINSTNRMNVFGIGHGIGGNTGISNQGIVNTTNVGIWKCKSCTLENEHYRQLCAVCLEPRPRSRFRYNNMLVSNMLSNNIHSNIRNSKVYWKCNNCNAQTYRPTKICSNCNKIKSFTKVRVNIQQLSFFVFYSFVHTTHVYKYTLKQF